MGVSGELTVYVVAKYAECLDDLVPLPGQPCSSSAQTQVASRIRDAWDIELRWSPPLMPEWDTDRRLARLLNSVQIVAGLDPSLSSEAEIIEAVRALPSDVDAGPQDLWPLVDWPTVSDAPSGPIVWRLPAETANDALDRIFTFWVTQVRPLLSPALTAPPESWDPSILLASITFTLGPLTSSPATDPVIASCDDADDAGRPYVLHTRLIQELRILSEAGPAVTKAQELATVTSSVDVSGVLTFTVWFHLDQPVALTEPIQVESRAGVFGSYDPFAPADPSGVSPAFSDVWILTPKSEFAAVDRDQVAISFVPESVFVGDFSTTLADRVSGGLDLLDTQPSGEVVVYATVEVPAVVEQPPAPTPAPPVVEFVTITSSTPVDISDDFFMEFWFHPQFTSEHGPRVTIRSLEAELVTYVEESDPFNRSGSTGTFQSSPNVWTANFHSTFGQRAAYVRFLFYAAKTIVEVVDVAGAGQGETMTLVQWMKKSGTTFLNWNESEEMISAYWHLTGNDK